MGTVAHFLVYICKDISVKFDYAKVLWPVFCGFKDIIFPSVSGSGVMRGGTRIRLEALRRLGRVQKSTSLIIISKSSMGSCSRGLGGGGRFICEMLEWLDSEVDEGEGRDGGGVDFRSHPPRKLPAKIKFRQNMQVPKIQGKALANKSSIEQLSHRTLRISAVETILEFCLHWTK